MGNRKVITRVVSAIRGFAVVAIGIVTALSFTASAVTASTTPDDPPEYLNASESGGTQAEVDYWIGRVPCPELGDVTLNPATAFADGNSVQVNCFYSDETGRSFGGYSLRWSKLGAEGEFVCGLVSADLGWQRQIAQPDVDARVQLQFEAPPAEMSDEIAAGGDALYEFVRARGDECATYDGPECPEIDGWVRKMFFGPGYRMDVSGDDEVAYSCTYALPSDTFDGSVEQFFSVEVLREGDFVSADEVLIACSAGSWFAFGQGGVGTQGRHSATADYTIRSADPIDTAPLLGAIDAVIEQFGPTGSGCEGLELLSSDRYSPMPAYLADVFAAEKITTGRPAIIGAASSTAPTVPGTPSENDDTAETDDSVAAIGDGSETDDSVAPIGDGSETDDGSGSTNDSNDAAAIPDPGQGSGGLAWLWRTIAILGLVLSFVSLAVTFLLIRRESRVRPKFDAIRIIATLIVAAAMMFVFSKGAPIWAVVSALVLGAGLGYWQGANLVVRLSRRGVFAQRNSWAIATFAAGIVISQVAGLLNRTGVVALGITLTFFSAALAVGVVVGRTPKVNAARAAAIGTLAVLIVAMLIAAVPVPRSASASTQPDESRVPDGIGRNIETVAPENRTPTMEALVDMVPWGSIQMKGGLWDDTGKPFVELPVPRGLDTAPEPVSRTAAWTDIFNQTTSYELAETFTFSMRTDGFCCSVGYEAIGSRTVGENTEPVELIGNMADIQVFGVEGPGYSGGTFSSAVVGLPFTEIEEIDVADLTGAVAGTTCFRPVAETRNGDAQDATGGEARIERATPNVELLDYDLDLRLGASCDLPEFTIENALAMAPEVPPIDDPARQLFNAGGCPVRQELIGALANGTGFEGVHTDTVGEIFLDPNGQACDYGTLFDPPAIGQGGPGNTRQEFSIEFAKPRQGEWQRGYTAWWPDPCCVSFPSKMVPPSDDLCTTDERDVPVAPADFDQGGACSLVTQHRIEDVEGAQIWISTEYVTDGPNTTVRVELPWGAFRSRCHHCEPGDPRIVDFINRMVEFGNDAASNIGVAGEVGEAIDLGEIGEAPGSRQEAEERAAAEAAEAAEAADPDAVARQEAEDLVDLVLDDDATDAEREVAIAAVIALLGAAAVGASTLGEAGVDAGEVWEAWRSGGRDGVDDLIRDRNTPDPMEGAVDEAEPERDVRVFDPVKGEATWMTQDEADVIYGGRREDEIAASIAAGRGAGAEWLVSWGRAAEAERAAEQAAREAAQEAWDRYDRLGDIAIDHDRLDILERLSRDETFFDENGNIDQRRQEQLTDMMRDHLWGEQVAPDPEYSETGQLIVDIGNSLDEFSRSIPVRIATGMATGGASEIYHQGRTVVEAVRDASERSVEWTRDPVTGEWRPPQEDFDVIDGVRVAMDATARENIPGYGTATTLMDPNATAADVAGAVFWDAIGAAMARGELDEAMDQLRTLGRGGRVGAGTRLSAPDPNLPRIRAEAGEVIAPGPYSADFLPQNRVGDDLSRLARGEVVPNDLLHQTGWSQAQVDQMNRIARANDAIIDARTTRPESMQLVRDGNAIAKPLPVKSKTLGIEDYYAGGCELDDIGKVGHYDPSAVTPRPIPTDAPPGLATDVQRRIAERADQFTRYDGTYSNLDGVEVRNGIVYDVDSGLPYAGDIDAVAFRDRTTGQPLTGERLARADAMWRNEPYVGPGGDVTPANPEWAAAGPGQHGAEANSAMGVIDSRVEARVAALDPTHPDYLDHLREAQHAGYADARDFQNSLLDNSVGPSARETTLSIDGSGSPRIAETEWAADLIR